MAIYCQKNIGDQAGKHLDHQALTASRDEVINLEMAFPPGKEGFYLPAQLVDQSNLLGSEVKTAGGNPIGFAFNRADQAKRGLGLIYAFPAQENFCIGKHEAAGHHGIRFQAGTDGLVFDAGDEVLSCRLELIKIAVTLISPVADSGIPRREYAINKRAFSLLATGEEYFAGDGAIEIKADMRPGLFGPFAVIGPLHGEHSVDQ